MAVPGSSFGFNVNLMGASEFNFIPRLYSDGVRRIHCFSLPCPKQNNLVLTITSARGKKIQFFTGQCQSKHQSGRPPPFGQNLHSVSLLPCQVKSDNTEETPSGESFVSDEETLKRDLQIAIEEENYAEAAKIRDTLRVLCEDSKALVLAANSQFYEAFRNGDLATMQGLWAKGDNVCCVHPGANGISGYDFVMESWEVVWMNYEFPLEIKLKDIRVHVTGDLGYVTAMEFVKTKGSSWGGQFVTNVFERIDGKWFICVHHASPIDL